MKTFRILSIVFLGATLLTSCDWHTTRTVIGSGDIETKEIAASDFTGINVTGSCNVDFTIADTFSVKLHAQQEILDFRQALWALPSILLESAEQALTP